MMRKKRNRKGKPLSNCEPEACAELKRRASIFTKDFKAVASSVSGWKEGEA